MRFVLDTHILIWAMYQPERLPEDIRTVLEDDESDVEYSIVSLWEAEVKHNKQPDSFIFSSDDLRRDAQLSGFHMMRLSPEHISTLGELNKPKIRHKDPFDRMLIAQAKCDNIYLLTHDKKLSYYEEECVQYL